MDGDYIVDEKARTATLTPAGVKKAEAFFQIDNLMDMENATYLHHVNQAIKAYGTMRRDIDYVAVSYTHLDVYKRQAFVRASTAKRRPPLIQITTGTAFGKNPAP